MAEFRLTPEERAIQPEREQGFIEALYTELANAPRTRRSSNGGLRVGGHQRDAARWRLLTHHGVLLLAIASAPDARVRELAAATGVTERTCHRIINDLCSAGYLRRRKVGHRNVYELSARATSPDEVARLFRVLNARPPRKGASIQSAGR